MASREDLIATTIELVRRQGVAGTGIADIIEHSGRSRRTIYLNFPGGKAELVAAATDVAGRRSAALIASIIDRTANLTEVPGLVLAWRKDALRSSGFRTGCPIAAAAVGGTDAPLAARTAGKAFESWIALLADALVERGGLDRTAARARHRHDCRDRRGGHRGDRHGVDATSRRRRGRHGGFLPHLLDEPGDRFGNHRTQERPTAARSGRGKIRRDRRLAGQPARAPRGWVHNIATNPTVRIRQRRTWRSGVAELRPDDDVAARTRTFATHRFLAPLTAASFRALQSDPISVRITFTD
ncbi:putative TetR family transcriptional regulator [Gordonia araii NBRC 100433]|uniref:Putative TetR family transcriptional regulator n=1 Tax=Gordonia araii NBRC 100433 TaxID=1073574 RepID=G7GZM7_9ACTN|nr:nitroreductase/quinone reductase family protein [Gordonia araii]GAB09052.1 putative TetR family transcriptional regulator [Gordonia araii NBRC 100433]